MPSKLPKPVSRSWIDIFKSQRGEPIPPRRVIQPEDRPVPTEADWDEDEELDVCVFCGEEREASEFLDGLRCESCASEDDDILDEVLYPDDRDYEYDIGGEG